jgi:hypothetical protein
MSFEGLKIALLLRWMPELVTRTFNSGLEGTKGVERKETGVMG